MPSTRSTVVEELIRDRHFASTGPLGIFLTFKVG